MPTRLVEPIFPSRPSQATEAHLIAFLKSSLAVELEGPVSRRILSIFTGEKWRQVGRAIQPPTLPTDSLAVARQVVVLVLSVGCRWRGQSWATRRR